MSKKSHETEKIKVPDGNMLFLVVENNPIIADYLKTVLNRHFHPCVMRIVDGLPGCMASLQEKGYHLILLDCTLEETNGEDSCRSIREVNAKTPIIMMAVTETKVTQEYIMSCGADGIIYKPIEVDELLTEINRVIDVDLSQRGNKSGFYSVLNPFE